MKKNERYIPFISLISFHSSVYWDRKLASNNFKGFNYIVGQLKPSASSIKCKGKKVEGDSQIVIGLMETIMKCFLYATQFVVEGSCRNPIEIQLFTTKNKEKVLFWTFKNFLPPYNIFN